MTAAVALITMATERRCAAARDGVEHLDLWIGQGSSIAIQKSTAAPVNDIGRLPGWPCHGWLFSGPALCFLELPDRDLIKWINGGLKMPA